jgi:hypothetical protein
MEYFTGTQRGDRRGHRGEKAAEGGKGESADLSESCEVNHTNGVYVE